eukprot:Hpha_TRINITY_DN8923_c0_g1::TRINITY_DN8923_c0_g1_i1::g.81041::m.81041
MELGWTGDSRGAFVYRHMCECSLKVVSHGMSRGTPNSSCMYPSSAAGIAFSSPSSSRYRLAGGTGGLGVAPRAAASEAAAWGSPVSGQYAKVTAEEKHTSQIW